MDFYLIRITIKLSKGLVLEIIGKQMILNNQKDKNNPNNIRLKIVKV